MPTKVKIRKKDNKLILTGFLVLLIGLAGLVLPLYYLGFSSRQNFSAEVAGLANAQVQTIESSNDSDADQNRLIISKIGVNMPLFTGGSESILSKGGWLFPTNPTPDMGGNTAIFAHRFKYLPPMGNTFYNLDKIVVGDEFFIRWKGYTYNYRVKEIKIVEPTDVWILTPTEQDQVTLVTCTPLFSTAQRLVVVADRI